MEESAFAVAGHHVSVAGGNLFTSFHIFAVDIAAFDFRHQIIAFAVGTEFAGGIKRQCGVSRIDIKQHVGRAAAGGEHLFGDIAEISFSGPTVDGFDLVQNPVSSSDNSVSHSKILLWGKLINSTWFDRR